MHLTCVVNGSRLVEPLDWLAESSIAWEGILFAEDPLGSGSSSFRVLPQCHHSVHLSVCLLSSNKTKRTFEPCTQLHVIVTYILRAEVCGMKGRCMY